MVKVRYSSYWNLPCERVVRVGENGVAEIVIGSRLSRFVNRYDLPNRFYSVFEPYRNSTNVLESNSVRLSPASSSAILCVGINDGSDVG